MADLHFTSPEDVRSRWIGDDLEATDAQIETLLRDAEDTVLREFPGLPGRVDAEGGIPLFRVQKVIARVVIRHLRNPEGIRQTQEGAGPFSKGVTFGGEEPGSIYLTDEDRVELGGTLTGSAFSIDQTPAILPTSPETWLAYGRTWIP